MKSIRVKNLHCISDTKDIPLKGINLLVGANSSGKSSFLRLFPLLKQSLDVKKRGPLLWYGDDVDFGTFQSACKKGENFIELEFKIELKDDNLHSWIYPFYRAKKFKKGIYCVSIRIQSHEKIDYISDLHLVCTNQRIHLKFTSKNEIDEIYINETNYSSWKKQIESAQWNSFLPGFFFYDSKKQISFSHRASFIPDFLTDIIRNNSSSRISNETVKKVVDSLTFGNKDSILLSIKRLNRPVSLKKKTVNWSIENSEFLKLNDAIVLLHLPQLISIIDRKLIDSIENTHYIGPFRATAQRYYRKQNLSVSEIDSQGFNLPMFIDNLSAKKQEGFKNWMRDKFNFYIKSSSYEGHLSLMLIDVGSKEEINLADRGFGFSQLLPIITMLWKLENSRDNKHRNLSNIIFAIEQPELHLHPLLQKKLANAFISAVNLFKEKDINLKLILETHSQTIVNQIGLNIERQKISPKDITVALFNECHEDKADPITQAKYNEEGYLENWPIGFFDV